MVISDLQFDCVTVFLKLNPHSQHANVSLANTVQIQYKYKRQGWVLHPSTIEIQKTKQGRVLHASVSLAELPSPAVID